MAKVKKRNNIKESLLAKYGIYATILIGIVGISGWLKIEIPKGQEGVIIILMLIGALIIWID